MVAGRPSPAPLGPVYPAGSALGGGWGLLWPYGSRVFRWCLDAVLGPSGLSAIAEDNETSVEVDDQQSLRIVYLEEQKSAQAATIATQAEALAVSNSRIGVIRS